MALQNLELKGKKARYDWIKPFDKIAFYASRQSWLEDRSVNITNLFIAPKNYKLVSKLQKEMEETKNSS